MSENLRHSGLNVAPSTPSPASSATTTSCRRPVDPGRTDSHPAPPRSLTSTTPRPGGIVAGAHRPGPQSGLRPVAACGTSPPSGGAGLWQASNTGQAIVAISRRRSTHPEDGLEQMASPTRPKRPKRLPPDARVPRALEDCRRCQRDARGTTRAGRGLAALGELVGRSRSLQVDAIAAHRCALIDVGDLAADPRSGQLHRRTRYLLGARLGCVMLLACVNFQYLRTSTRPGCRRR
jgi:hypothetical protein